jgi:hypothetical protein
MSMANIVFIALIVKKTRIKMKENLQIKIKLEIV